MILFIPTSSDPFYSQVVPLEGVSYVFEFRYNQRETCWYLNISDLAGDLLCCTKLVCNFPILRKYTDTRLPPGELLVAAPPTGDLRPPGLTDFGAGLRCQMIYLTSDML